MRLQPFKYKVFRGDLRLIFSRVEQFLLGLFAGMPLGSDRNCPQQVLLCSDIALANPDRTCGHLVPGFEEKY
ncbi:hypothetical protein QUB57_23905 [Microcoleus sp. F6_C1]